MQNQKFLAVRVVIKWSDGAFTHRDYVRGEKRVGRVEFERLAVGDFIATVIGGFDSLGSVAVQRGIKSITVDEIEPDLVRINNKYNHTTHTTRSF